MEVLMGIFLKACVAVVVGVICLVGLILIPRRRTGKKHKMGRQAKARRTPGI